MRKLCQKGLYLGYLIKGYFYFEFPEILEKRLKSYPFIMLYFYYLFNNCIQFY